jgi:hypothetical protein
MCKKIPVAHFPPFLLSRVNNSLRASLCRPGLPDALSAGIAGRRWARRGAVVVRFRIRLVLGCLPGSRSSAWGLDDQIQGFLGFLSPRLVLRWSELEAAEGSKVSFNKVVVIFRIQRLEILGAELLLAGRGGEEEERLVEDCSWVKLLLDGRGGEGEKLRWTSSSASTMWRLASWFFLLSSCAILYPSLFGHGGKGRRKGDVLLLARRPSASKTAVSLPP